MRTIFSRPTFMSAPLMLAQTRRFLYSIAMSEGVPQHNRIEELLDHSQFDPYVSGVFAAIQEYNALLHGTWVSESGINEIMRSLDEKWKNIINQPVKVTADLRIRNADRTWEKVLLEDVSVLFRGVFPYDDDTTREDGEAQYTLQVGFHYTMADEDGTDKKYLLRAAVEDIVALDILPLMSKQYAMNWLSLTEPQLMDALHRVLGRGYPEECTRTRALGDLYYRTTKKSEEDVVKTINALNCYCNDEIRFDTHVGYIISGDTRNSDELDNDTEHATFYAVEGIGSVDRLRWMRLADAPEYIVPHVECRVVDCDDPHSVRAYWMPVSRLHTFISLRHQYYQEHAKEI